MRNQTLPACSYPCHTDPVRSKRVLLPPASEVWGKVMFFTLVCHFVHMKGQLASQPESQVT